MFVLVELGHIPGSFNTAYRQLAGKSLAPFFLLFHQTNVKIREWLGRVCEKPELAYFVIKTHRTDNYH